MQIIKRLLHYAHIIVRDIILGFDILGLRIDKILHRNDYKNVGLVVDQLNKGGMERIVIDLYKKYRENNIKSYIIIAGKEASEYLSEIEDDPRHFRLMYWNKRNLIKFCKKNKIKTLHYHFSTFGMRSAFLAGIKNIYTFHNTYVWLGRRAWLSLKINLCFCHEKVAVSNFVKKYVTEKANIKNVRVIPNGVDLEGWLMEDEEKNNRRARGRLKYGIKEDEYLFLNLASFTEQKYQIATLGAFKDVFKKNKKAKIIFCGAPIDKKIFNRLTKEARTEKDSILVVDGVFGEDVKDLVCSADCVIMTSIYEGGVPPLSILESIASGKEVIMTDLGLSGSEFEKFINIIPPIIDDISQLNVKEIKKMVFAKRPQRYSYISKTMEKVMCGNGKKLPEISKEDISLMSVDRMAKQYIEIL